ncbi:hypothetical protein ACIOJD_04310 [Streptomyces sp. NPDC088116]|uniref:hypothetical protein n=1 Tax=Streptomyces sp. NPDC088116 TaxID=3365825 RepID=UPI003802D996
MSSTVGESAVGSIAVIGLVAVWAAAIVAPTVAGSQVPVTLRTMALPAWGALFALGLVVVVARGGAYALLGAHH